ncbi:MAG: type II toxin-antitoxin system HicA family toxin [Lachnospiraceae bacterium]|nr:type II toxin-antitoxin system HicA family toxin [Lachnospiraceae bacterium]
MKTSELTKKLRKGRCRLIEHGTNHDIWFSPITGKEFLVPRHPSKEIKTGTATTILKDAGLK